MIFPPAPSAAPTSVSASEVTSSSITVQWGAVDCIHRNGDITGYSVGYGVQGSGSTQTESVSGGGVTMGQVSGLVASTTYSIEVAAVNSAGTGIYSPIIMQLTQGIVSYILFGMTCTSFTHYKLPLQLKLQSCQLGQQQPPPSPSPGPVLAQWWTAMR